MISYEFKNAVTFTEAVEQLYHILGLLRSPEGCPWDREQTHSDITRALLDEIYEYIDALREHNTAGCLEEIGDMMLNVCMLLTMHEQAKEFEAVEAINAVCEKLIRRHPHVFSHASAVSSSQVLDIWNAEKEKEKPMRGMPDFFSRIPKSLPVLEEAWEIQKLMRGVGFDWPDIEGVMDKVSEEQQELFEAIAQREAYPERVEEELGDLLFAIVNLARYLKISPSIALHRSNCKVRKRFNQVASVSADRNIELCAKHSDIMNKIWEEIKQG